MSEDAIFRKCAWRLLPLVIAGMVINYLDRTNVAFAALTMNKDLGFSPSVYGLGASIFFLSYALLAVPANLMLYRIGARRWIFFILASWGAAAAASALIRGPDSFYGLRFLLGAAEGGFFPGIILYLSLWFPKAWLGRATAMFNSAGTATLILGGPLASLILGLEGVAGMHGWQWLFLLEGVPACLIGLAVLKLLPDGPAHASWLKEDEQRSLTARLQAEESGSVLGVMRALRDARVLMLGLALGGIVFANYSIIFWLPLLVQGMGFSNTENGLIVALVYAAAVPGMIAWGRSSDRIGERIWHVAIPAVFAAASLAVASVVRSDLVQLLALAAAAIGIWAVIGTFFALPALFLKGPAMAGGIALINTMGNLLGGFAGQYVIGIMREQTGSYAAGFVVMGAALLLSAVIVLAVGRSAGPRWIAADAKVSGA